MIKRKESFKIVQRGRSEKVFNEDGKLLLSYLTEKWTKKSDMSLFKQVKDDIKRFDKKNPIPKPILKPELHSTKKKDIIELCDNRPDNWILALDINNCYWKTAFNLGFISEKTYNKGLDNKLIRNMTIGNLIRVDREFDYDKGKLVNTNVIQPEEVFENAYWAIINKVKEVMDEVMSIEGTLVWDTDCVIYDQDLRIDPRTTVGLEVQKVMNKHGYEYKSYPLFENYWLSDKNTKFHYKEEYLGKSNERVFTL